MESKIVIWDIDGVLIYVVDSYRKAIVDTVQYYFSECVGLKLEKSLMDRANTQEFKLAGGFNDDWELTYAAILCYLSELISNMGKKPDLEFRPEDIDGMLKGLKDLGSVYGGGPLELDLGQVTKRIREHGGGLSATEKTLSELFGEDLEIARKFFFPELIKRIFDEMYLGKDLFYKKYGENPRFYGGKGLISKERPLVDLKTLLELQKRYYFGIVTGRERFEAEFSLKKHGLQNIFSSDLMITREDTREKKPSPQPLLECRKRICEEYGLSVDTKAVYIGDSIDDLKAARNADFYFVAILSGIEKVKEIDILRKEFQDMKCDLIVDDVGELLLHL